MVIQLARIHKIFPQKKDTTPCVLAILSHELRDFQTLSQQLIYCSICKSWKQLFPNSGGQSVRLTLDIHMLLQERIRRQNAAWRETFCLLFPSSVQERCILQSVKYIRGGVNLCHKWHRQLLCQIREGTDSTAAETTGSSKGDQPRGQRAGSRKQRKRMGKKYRK